MAKRELKSIPAYTSQNTFTPAVFQGVAMDFEQPDINILQHSLDKIDAQTQQAIEKRSGISDAIGKYAAQLHDDAETKQYIKDLEDDIDNQVSVAISLGTPDSAIRIAHNVADDLAKNAELQGRIKTQAQWSEHNKKLDSLAGNGNSHATIEWAKNEKNKYNFVPIKDAEGNVIGAEDYNAFTPVKDIDWSNYAKQAFSMINPDSTTKGSQTTKTWNELGDKGGVNSSHTKGGGKTTSFTEVTRQEIIDSMEDLLLANNDTIAAIKQSYDVAVYNLKKEKDKLASIQDKNSDDYKNQEFIIAQQKKLLYRNAVPININDDSNSGLKEYYANMILNSPYAKSLAYKHESTQTNSNQSDVSTYNSENSNAPLVAGTDTNGNYFELYERDGKIVRVVKNQQGQIDTVKVDELFNVTF